ncbi:MAG: hypothetical protein PF689_05675 [Deltaproteobacteria bacterium]|jgi:hypothetical protein|nr:hypothetical protein [Deltaproteobacteria bacterium]
MKKWLSIFILVIFILGGCDDTSSDNNENNIDPCADITCGFNSHCVAVDGNGVCTCDQGYTKEDEECINTKMVDCIDQAPENGESWIEEVEITWDSNNGWSEPEVCEWRCLESHYEENGECVACPSAPAECTPWVPTALISEELNQRFDHLACDNVESGSYSRIGLGKKFPLECQEPYGQGPIPYQYIYLIDLEAFTSEIISYDESNFANASIYQDTLIADQWLDGDVFLQQYDQTGGDWNILLHEEGHIIKEPFTGDGFVAYLSNENSSAEYHYGLYIKLLPDGEQIELMEPGYTVMGFHADSELVAWIEDRSTYPGENNIYFYVYEPATGIKKQVELPEDFPLPKYPVVSKRKVLFDGTKNYCGKTNYDLYLFDFDEETIEEVMVHQWWDSGSAYAFNYPLVVYSDYSVGCNGYFSPDDFDTSSAFLVVHDLETGEKRPLAITEGPDWTMLLIVKYF